jgi:hypothetical protein
MAYNRDKLFANMGKRIAVWYEYRDLLDTLELAREQQITLLDDSEDEGDWLQVVLDTYKEHKDLIDDMKAGIVADITEYLLTGVRADLNVVPRDVDEVLDELEDQMYLNDDCVLEDVIVPMSSDPPTGASLYADIDNEGSLRVVGLTNAGQQVHDDYDFEAVCYDISAGAGNELWLVKAHNNLKPGTVPETLGTLTTGVLFENFKYGLAVTINEVTAIVESGDGLNQLSNWVLNDAVKSRGSEFNNDEDTDFYGNIYVTLADVAGTRTVNLYNDSGLTNLVATGSRVGDGTITLAAQPGYNVNGTVDVAYSADDNSIILLLPFDIAVGDRILFQTVITTPALFQFFFVTEFDRALPACEDGSETVDEDFATIVVP